jgi:alpha-amylase/alpha-mannosidase (GH57 family)
MTTPRRRVCVHAHFYQPPRENPWLGEIEREDSAAPFHDWNERIAEECYGPIETLLSRLSFNVGPTLLDWLERRRPEVYRRFIEADRASAQGDGLGNALAQPYFHAILPLQNRRDKETLVRWGLADFRARFGRNARGMWLPETGVDDETLDVLAAEGVEFTVLDPAQAAAVRNVGEEWRDADAETLDPKLPYLWVSPRDPSRRLAIFFYHRSLSRGIVSGAALDDPAGFAAEAERRMLGGDAAQLVGVASDGEFYGHHHKDGIRALTRALDGLADRGLETTNYARFLSLFPPPREVRVKERTAWSCAHGLGRWESDCGCRYATDSRQAWRGPLRAALDALARRVDAFYEDDAGRFFAKPWALRDLAPSIRRESDPEKRRARLEALAERPLSEDEVARVLRLLALQRERLAMFTSCGWFFDDVSGIETVQILQRAARVCDLARSLGEEVEEAFVERLAAAPSNSASLRDGAGVYRRLVAPTRVSLERAAAHAAVLDHVGLARARVAPSLRVELGPAFRSDKSGSAGRRPGLSVRLASVERAESGEAAEFHAIVHRDDALDFAVWLAPRSGPAVDPAELGDEFLRRDAASLRAGFDARFGPSRFGLDAVLSDDRRELARALTPGGALGPERAKYLSRWTAAVTAALDGGREDDAVLELLAAARAHAFRPEELPWNGALEDLLHERFADILAGGGAAAVSRALRWHDALQAQGLLRQPRRARDFARRWSEALASGGDGAERDACRAFGERLERGHSGLLETTR